MGGPSYQELKNEAKLNVKFKNALIQATTKKDCSKLLIDRYNSCRYQFIEQVAKALGMKQQGLGAFKSPKEFPGTEYEIKFNINITGSEEEPMMWRYLEAFDFPAERRSRFFRDNLTNIAEGKNYFIGDGLEEKLVIIEQEKCLILKEKSPAIGVNCGVDGENIILKRKEIRYNANTEKLIEKIEETLKSSENVSYRGHIIEEEGETFVLDIYSGRIYSLSVNISKTEFEKRQQQRVQRQLEVEYAGYIPGFREFTENSETQIVQGMVALSKYIYRNYNATSVIPGVKMYLKLTSERKYDFVNGIKYQPTISGKKEHGHYLLKSHEPIIRFITPKVRPLAEVTAADIPRGLSAEDVATDYHKF